MSKWVVAVAVCFAAAVPVQAQEDESRAIIDKAIKAQGGAAKLASLKAFTAKMKGAIEFMGEKLEFTLDAYSQPPNKAKSVIKLSIQGMAIDVVQAFTDDKGWKSVNGMVEDADKDELKERSAMKHIETVTGLFGLKDDKACKLSPLGETKVGDKVCVGVQVTKKDKRDVNLYFDKKTNLLVKAEYRAMEPFTKQEVAQEKLYSDYKELVPGLKMASKQVINNDGKRSMEVEITEVVPVEAHDDSIFAKPN